MRTGAQTVAAMAKAYRVYYKKVPLSEGGYTMDHTALSYLFDREGRIRVVLRHEQTADDYTADIRQQGGTSDRRQEAADRETDEPPPGLDRIRRRRFPKRLLDSAPQRRFAFGRTRCGRRCWPRAPVPARRSFTSTARS